LRPFNTLQGLQRNSPATITQHNCSSHNIPPNLTKALILITVIGSCHGSGGY